MAETDVLALLRAKRAELRAWLEAVNRAIEALNPTVLLGAPRDDREDAGAAAPRGPTP